MIIGESELRAVVTALEVRIAALEVESTTLATVVADLDTAEEAIVAVEGRLDVLEAAGN